jgi:uncharacterized alkaline shock family protein YloU
MAVSRASEDYALPCGRGIEELWQQLTAGVVPSPGSHEARCPHCRTALSGLSALRDATSELAAEPVTAPPRLAGAIMAAVRVEVRRARMLPMPGDDLEPGGKAEISEQAVAVVLRFAADSIEGVRARRCRVRPARAADGTPGQEDRVDVELTLAIRYGTSPAGQVLAAVRGAVLAAAEGHLGLRVARCDLLVDDVWPASGERERRGDRRDRD